jgi:hypothetical protein
MAQKIPQHHGKRIAEIGIGWLRLTVLIAVSAGAVAQSTPASEGETPRLMDRQKEIALALSACPASVVDKAAVYVLENSGYVKVRDSQNGFHGNRPTRTAQQPGSTMHGR